MVVYNFLEPQLNQKCLEKYHQQVLESSNHGLPPPQIQAFNVTSGKFSPASDCATFLTPAILMGLITSLILLLVLAYALHMVVHLKHIERDDDHKAEIYFSQYPEQPEHCCVENVAEKNTL